MSENMKYPINSNLDDFGITFEGKLNRGYLSSNREGTKGADDIWSFVMPSLLFTVEGVIKDEKFNEPIPGVTVILTGSDRSIVRTSTNAKGEFFFIEDEQGNRLVKENVDYVVTTYVGPDVITPRFRNGFVNSSVKYKFSTKGLTESTKFGGSGLRIKLTPIEEEIKFPAVLYEFAKSDLTPQAEDSLDILFQTLLDNPSFVIELSAHTDSRGSIERNMELSIERAKSCYAYLIRSGIPDDRMTYKGHGESKLKITDKVIRSLPSEEEREAAHQENRRTVFGVQSKDYPVAEYSSPSAFFDEEPEEVKVPESIQQESALEAKPKKKKKKKKRSRRNRN
jgi:outer membrane protein OmpA-like peptidoglycan-associated protein